METQARSHLEEEKLKTDNLKKELNDKFARFAARVEMEEERYMKIPDYVKLLEIEKEIKIKAAELKKLKAKQLAKSANEEVRLKLVYEDNETWLKFRSLCINFAEDWLQLKERERVLDSRYLEKQRLNAEIISLESHPDQDKFVKPPSPRESLSVTSVVFNSIANPNEPSREVQESVDCVSSSTLSSSTVRASGNDQSTEHTDHAMIIDTPTESVTAPSKSDSLLPLSNLANSTFVPPTPRTNLRQLKLCTSLLTAKKKMQALADNLSFQQPLPKAMPSLECVDMTPQKGKVRSKPMLRIPSLFVKKSHAVSEHKIQSDQALEREYTLPISTVNCHEEAMEMENVVSTGKI